MPGGKLSVKTDAINLLNRFLIDDKLVACSKPEM
jgi:hypothetical protein